VVVNSLLRYGVVVLLIAKTIIEVVALTVVFVGPRLVKQMFDA
jgi:hypothetical protein